jgi:hypothetical protein
VHKRFSWCSTLRLASLEPTLIPFVALEDPLRRARGIKASLEKKEGLSKKNEKHQGFTKLAVTEAGQFVLYGHRASWVERIIPASFREWTSF